MNPRNPSESVLYRTLRWERQAFMAIFALTFPAVGAGLVFAGLWGPRVMRKEAALSEKYPGEPWKWKTHWAGTTIDECPTTGRLPLFLYTLWSALIIFPLILATVMSGAFQTDRSAWLVLIYLALWCAPAWFASKRILHWLTVGKAKFEPQETPAWPGGVLRGSILLAKPLPARAVPELRLSCEKRVTTGSGEDKSTVRETIWSAHEALSQDRITRDFTGFRLPVSIAIPSDGPESGRGEDDSEEFFWNLKLGVSGTSVHSVFEIPVFRNGKSPTFMATAAGPSISQTLTNDLPVLLAENGIQAEFDQGGMPLTIMRPPAQRPSWMVFPLLFNLVWTGMAIVLVRQNALLIGQILMILSAAFIWLLTFWRLLYRRTVTFTRDGVKLRHQLGPASREETIGKSQIAGISHDSNMISNNAKFYRVRLVTVLGKKKTVADGIKGSTAAEALVGRLEAWKQSG